MLKRYLINGKEWQFEEGKQPSGAIEVEKKMPKAPAEKAIKKLTNKAKPASRNKAR